MVMPACGMTMAAYSDGAVTPNGREGLYFAVLPEAFLCLTGFPPVRGNDNTYFK